MRPHKKNVHALIAVMIAVDFLGSIDQSMVNVALDAVSTEYGIPLADANWMVLAFSIVTGCTIMTAASLLKRFGLRKLTIVACVTSLAGSVLGSFAFTFPMLVAARCLQAFTAGLIFPLFSTVILIVAPPNKKATLIAIGSTAVGIGLAISPVLSGMLITYAGLRTMFIAPAVFSALLLVVSFLCVYNVEQREMSKVDFPSVALGSIGFLAVIYGLNMITKSPWFAVGCMAVGAIALALFARRQKRLENPLLDLKPFKNAVFTFGEAVAMLCFMSSLYSSLLVPLFLEGTASMTTFEAGLWMIAPILCYCVSTYIGGRIEDAHGIWPLAPIGFAVVLSGLVGMEFFSSVRNVVLLLVFSGVTYFGVGLVYSPMKSHDLESVKTSNLSSASSIHSVFTQVVTSTASALFVGIMSSDVLTQMAQHVSKADAYAAGFSHTLFIDIGIAAVAFIVCILYILHMKKQHGNKVAAQK